MFGKQQIFTNRIHTMTTFAFGLALLFAIFAMPSSAEAAGRPIYCERYHTVQQGENIASIAAYYSVDYYSIGIDSGLQYPFYLFVGQRLCINGATLPVTQAPTATPYVPTPTPYVPTATPYVPTATPYVPVSHIPASQAPASQAPPMLEEPAQHRPHAAQAPQSSHQSPAQAAVPAPPRPRPRPQAQSQPSYSCTYVVKSGDMLSRIARYHGISMRALARANNLHNVNNIYVGQHLVVPCK